jgi:hypothetical protein
MLSRRKLESYSAVSLLGECLITDVFITRISRTHAFYDMAYRPKVIINHRHISNALDTCL